MNMLRPGVRLKPLGAESVKGEDEGIGREKVNTRMHNKMSHTRGDGRVVVRVGGAMLNDVTMNVGIALKGPRV